MYVKWEVTSITSSIYISYVYGRYVVGQTDCYEYWDTCLAANKVMLLVAIHASQ